MRPTADECSGIFRLIPKVSHYRLLHGSVTPPILIVASRRSQPHERRFGPGPQHLRPSSIFHTEIGQEEVQATKEGSGTNEMRWL